MFLPNLDGPLTNIFNALKNGGRFGAAVWSSAIKGSCNIGFPMSIIMREFGVSNPTNSASASASAPQVIEFLDLFLLLMKEY